MSERRVGSARTDALERVEVRNARVDRGGPRRVMNLKSCAAAESASGHTRSREADNTRTMSDPNDAKRAREEEDDGPPVGPAPPGHGDAQEEDDGPVGPAMPPAKKKKTLPFEQVYLDSLPCGAMYEKSYMHRDFATHVAATPGTDFFITASADGHLKFWKKRSEDRVRQALPFPRRTGHRPQRQRGRALLRHDRSRQVCEGL